MINQAITFWDGLVVLRQYASRHGIKMNGCRPVKMEVWGMNNDEAMMLHYSLHPLWGELWLDDELIYESKRKMPKHPVKDSRAGEFIWRT